MATIPAFDQYVEYVTEGPVVHHVTLAQHSLESVDTLEIVAGGYARAAVLGRAVLPGAAELALVFAEWTPAGGLVAIPGVVASAVIAGWTAKSIAAAYIVATSAAVDAINASRTQAIALIRLSLVEGGSHPLAPRTVPTSAQVTALSAWLNNHTVTNAEFAALFGVTAAQLATWLTTHPRWQIAAVLHERFG